MNSYVKLLLSNEAWVKEKLTCAKIFSKAQSAGRSRSFYESVAPIRACRLRT